MAIVKEGVLFSIFYFHQRQRTILYNEKEGVKTVLMMDKRYIGADETGKGFNWGNVG